MKARSHWSLSVICQPQYLKEYILAEMTVFGIDYSPTGEEQYYKRKAKKEAEKYEEVLQKLSEQIQAPVYPLTMKERKMLYDAAFTRDPLIVYNELMEAKQRHIQEVMIRRQRLEPVKKYLVRMITRINSSPIYSLWIHAIMVRILIPSVCVYSCNSY